MYAVLRTGGKQYRVRPGDVLRVEKLNADDGSEIDFNEILFLRKDGSLKSDSSIKLDGSKDGSKSYIGNPVVQGAKVKALVLGQGRDKKILVFKKRRRKSYRRTQGHRQNYSEVLIQSIHTPEGEIYKHLAQKKKKPTQ